MPGADPVSSTSRALRGSINRFLAGYGVHTCGEVKKLPISVLARRFGNPGRRIWYMCQGQDPAALQQDVPAPESIGHGKVVPSDTRDPGVLLTYLMHIGENVDTRRAAMRLPDQRWPSDYSAMPPRA